MPRNKFISNCILLPLSRLYGLGVGVRSLMFKWGIFKRRTFDIPVIVVGNIAVGGTGKTPHTEYIVTLLRSRYNVGVVSRGYKRRTKGFVLATDRTTPLDIGDEPYQIYHKFGGSVPVAVCEKRCEGIDRLRAIDPGVNLIVLDDAFQHRYVNPAVSVVLTEFKRPVFFDKLMPLGRLREPMKAIEAADIVVVSKCPDEIKPLETRLFKKNLNLFPTQKLMFSRLRYLPPQAVFPDQSPRGLDLNRLDGADRVLILSGIANPRPFVRYLKTFKFGVRLKVFSDHHNFTRHDMDTIQAKFEDIDAPHKFIVTTEKDAVRLSNNPYYPHELKAITYYIPVTVEFDTANGDNFDSVLQRLIIASSALPLTSSPASDHRNN